MLLTTLLLTILAYFAASTIIADRLTRPIRPPHRATPADFGLPYEDIRLPARDGLPIAGWYIPRQGAKHALLVVHGLWMSRRGEFDGRWLEFAARLHAHGYALLLIDLRAHGDSAGANFTLGAQERLDVLGAVDWLQGQGFHHIGIHGVSLGAASAIEAAADPVGSPAIRAIVADGTFATLRDLLDCHFARVTGLPRWLLPGGILMTRLMRGTNINAINPVASLPKVTAPVLLIHSDADRIIPPTHFAQLSRARPDAPTWTVPTSKHARIYNDHPDEYVTQVVTFFDKHLP
jgi:pimeloyl-ACP methyl ester carboxylesterase